MALGAVAAILVIVLAATQLPRWYKAGAKSTLPTQQQEIPVPPAQPPQAESTTPVAPPAQVQPPPAGASSSESRTQAAPPKTRAGSPTSQRPVTAQPPPAQAAQPPPPQQTTAPPPPADTADREALQQLRERMVFLASRANALRSSLQNLEQQQRASGLSLRTDISASWKRMELLLDEAEAALKARDVNAAKRNLDLAEREVDRLDQFLGK